LRPHSQTHQNVTNSFEKKKKYFYKIVSNFAFMLNPIVFPFKIYADENPTFFVRGLDNQRVKELAAC